MGSIWSETTKLPQFEALNHDITTDVLIIGGGMAGILCANRLKQEGIDYVLVEADKIGCGITQNTTAKITVQHGLVYQKIDRTYGLEKARMYLDANQAAVEEYKTLCRNMDCDFEQKDSFVYVTKQEEELERELEILAGLGVPAKYEEELPLPFVTAGAIRIPSQAQFHPLKFLAWLTPELNIYENTRVKELIKTQHSPYVSTASGQNYRKPQYQAVTERGTITANKIIVATHFPFLNKHGSYFLKMYQSRSYVLALKSAQDFTLNGMYVDAAENGLSFRAYKGMLLLGGGGHRTGKKGGNWKELEEFARLHYLHTQEKYRWATQDCMTLDGIPYIGNYSAHTPDMYVATGFNKWGMTSSMVAADILVDKILGKQNPYAEVFSPSRSMLHAQLLVNAVEATANLFTFSSKRCPHLGCTLKWNPHEHSWDCPCHGSRFTEDGRLIDNPAMGDLPK